MIKLLERPTIFPFFENFIDVGNGFWSYQSPIPLWFLREILGNLTSCHTPFTNFTTSFHNPLTPINVLMCMDAGKSTGHVLPNRLSPPQQPSTAPVSQLDVGLHEPLPTYAAFLTGLMMCRILVPRWIEIEFFPCKSVSHCKLKLVFLFK